MTNFEDPRIMLPEEYEELMDLQEKAQGVTRSYILTHWPHTAKRENIVFNNRFVISEEGKMVSHVGLFPMEAIADGSTVKIGAIGDVATHPDYQGKGYMGKLMEFAATKMKEREIPLSILWGDTQRYRHYGWETAGRKIVFHLNRHSVKEMKVGKEFNLRGYEKKDLDKIMEIHEREPSRIKRSKEGFEKLLERTQIQIWIGEEKDSCAYAVLDGSEVIEFGGDPSLIAKFFACYLSHYPISNMNLHLPYKNSQMLRVLYKISDNWKVVPLGMIKIIDLEKTLLGFKKQIQEKTELYGIGKESSITLKMTDSNQKATLVIGKKIEIRNEEGMNIIALSDIEMVRLLFGPSLESFGGNREEKRLLSFLFPLNFHVWGLDHV